MFNTITTAGIILGARFITVLLPLSDLILNRILLNRRSATTIAVIGFGVLVGIGILVLVAVGIIIGVIVDVIVGVVVLVLVLILILVRIIVSKRRLSLITRSTIPTLALSEAAELFFARNISIERVSDAKVFTGII